MEIYAKLTESGKIEYAPKNKGAICNYNLDIESLIKDGYKPFIEAVVSDIDRKFEVSYQDNPDSIVEIVNYLETEKEYNTRKNNELIKKEIDSINIQISQLDLKRIRAICEPSIKDETTGETWLEYYNTQIVELRNQIQELNERIK